MLSATTSSYQGEAHLQRAKAVTRAADQEATAIAQQYLLETAQTATRVAHQCVESVLMAAKVIAHSLEQGGKLLVCGNGGSAADSQHLAAEFVNIVDRGHRPRPAMAAISLATDTSILTAIANDFGYARVFARQVEALGRSGDVLLGISTSANSENVLSAFESARAKSMITIALAGRGGELLKLADVAICIPSTSTEHIQEAHVAVEHLLCRLTETLLFGHKVEKQ